MEPFITKNPGKFCLEVLAVLENTKNLILFYVKSASGCKFTDLDGNIYVDLLMGNGVNILGHGNKLIRGSVLGAIDNPPFIFFIA